MFEMLFRLSDLKLFLLLSSVSIIFSLLAIYLVKCFIPLNTRYKVNAIIGNTSAILAVIYGVLAGLSALYLINNNSYTADAVIREANAVADIYRYSNWLNEPTRSSIQSEIKKYLTNVIAIEWPHMEKGEPVNRQEGVTAINTITNQLIHYNGRTNSEALLVHDMLDEIRSLYNARQQRIHMTETLLSPELWVVIIIGTILTLCINFLFGMNFYLHAITVCAVALMTSSMIFLLITLDKPFQGEFNIRPDAFVRILHSIEQNEVQITT